MSKNYPNKYKFLQQLANAGVRTPATLLLSNEDCVSSDLARVLDSFLLNNKSDHYIVRSCVVGEDGNTESLAGHFASSEKIKPAQLLATVKTYAKQNLKLQTQICPEGTMNLMVQPFIESDVGGVLFSQWKYFSHHCVGELSLGGADKSVSGEASDFFLIGTENQFVDITTIDEGLKKNLLAMLMDCRSKFDFPMDIEWVAKDNRVTVVQVRPITRAVPALRVATKKEIVAEKEFLNQNDLVIDAFGESFGMLSPLSFSILKDNFKASLKTFRGLGFTAQNFDFLWRSRNGQIYTDPTARDEFFKLKSFVTPFWQVVHESKFKQQRTDFSLQSLAPDFDYKRLKEIFAHWQIANFYALQSKENLNAQTQSGEYEILTVLDIDFPIPKDEMLWPDWRDYYKQWWLFELNKLKKLVVLNPLLAFAEFSELETVTPEVLLKRYDLELPYSIIDYPSDFGSINIETKATAVVKGLGTTAPVFVIAQPKLFRGTIAKGVILVAPYFENDWVLEMDKLAGVILEKGGVLSHSAIVAREKNIPYYINWSGAVTEFLDGQYFELC